MRLRPLCLSDADELVGLQRAAFRNEAVLFDDAFLPALSQSVTELLQEMRLGSGIVAVVGTRMVGAVRTRQVAETLHITRLVVAPDLQGTGVGTTLMRAVEGSTTAVRACLFVRPRNKAVMGFYRRLGYTPTAGRAADAEPELIALAKAIPPRQA